MLFNCWNLLLDVVTTASRKAKPRFNKTTVGTISSQAPSRGRFIDYGVPASTGQATGKWEPSLVEEDIVRSLWRHRAGVYAHRLDVATRGDKTKGVVCQVWNDEDMPVDKHGTVADIIVDGNTTINRMNPPRLYEQFINGTADQIKRDFQRMIKELGFTDAVVDVCYNRLLRYYEIVSPLMFSTITSSTYQGSTPRQHLESILNSKLGIRTFIPTNNPVELETMMTALMEEFPIDVGPVTFRGNSGQVRTTRDPILISSFYVIELEKIGSDWSAVSSGTLQQHGILTKLTRHDKNARPGRASPTRTLGEDEIRLVAAVATNNTSAQQLVTDFGPTAADGLAAAEMADLANNPITHMEANRSLLAADKPTHIQTLIDRDKFPRGGGRSLTFIKHALQVAGINLTYHDDLEDDPLIYQIEDIALGVDSDENVAMDEGEED